MQERNVNTWEEFEKQLQDLRRERDESRDSPNSSLLFRGQEDSCWLLKTTLDRKRERMLFSDYYRVISRIQPQIETLTESEWPIPDYPKVEQTTKEYDSFNLQLWGGKCPGYAYMAYLRHHGFPSPLLDWTRSPYVAGYFALGKASMNFTKREFPSMSPQKSGIRYLVTTCRYFTDMDHMSGHIAGMYSSRANTRFAWGSTANGGLSNMTLYSIKDSINRPTV
jgi:hypothetical protein